MHALVDVKVAVVIPNWNGEELLSKCLDSLLRQTLRPIIIVVENGSTDRSLSILKSDYPSVELVVNTHNLGFAGGVNGGIRKAIAGGVDYVALLNNDAVAENNWLENLVDRLKKNKKVGIATSKFIEMDKKHIDSTGDLYTVWGLPFPRGRGEMTSDRYDQETSVFGASGGASLYRVSMLQEIGLFDEDFFAYYEDIDISFRAQLAGWKVNYVPEATAYHALGATSSKIKGFTTYQTTKNLPWLLWKNVPTKYLWNILPRFSLAYGGFMISALQRGQLWPALKGLAVSFMYSPKKLLQRIRIQSRKTVPDKYIWDIIIHDLPPNATKLRSLRSKWQRLRGGKYEDSH